MRHPADRSGPLVTCIDNPCQSTGTSSPVTRGGGTTPSQPYRDVWLQNGGIWVLFPSQESGGERSYMGELCRWAVVGVILRLATCPGADTGFRKGGGGGSW